MGGLCQSSCQHLKDLRNIKENIQLSSLLYLWVITKRVGIARGQNLYDDDYDFDEMNPEIAKMFG